MKADKLRKRMEESKKLAGVQAKEYKQREEVFTFMDQRGILNTGDDLGWKVRQLPPHSTHNPDGFVDNHICGLVMKIEDRQSKDGMRKYADTVKFMGWDCYDDPNELSFLKNLVESVTTFANANPEKWKTVPSDIHRAMEMLAGQKDYSGFSLYDPSKSRNLSTINIPILLYGDHEAKRNPGSEWTDWVLSPGSNVRTSEGDNVLGKILRLNKPFARLRNVQSNGVWTKEISLSGTSLAEKWVKLYQKYLPKKGDGPGLDAISGGRWLSLIKTGTGTTSAYNIEIHEDDVQEGSILPDDLVEKFYRAEKAYPNLIAIRAGKKDPVTGRGMREKTNEEIRDLVYESWLGKQLMQLGLLGPK